MAGRQAKLRPNRVRIANPGDAIISVCASRQAIYCDVPLKQTTKLDRSLQPLWQVQSSLVLSGTAGEDYITCSGGGVVGVRAADDGRVLWSVEAQHLLARDDSIEVQFSRSIEWREPASGRVLHSTSLDATLEEGAVKCGDAWLASFADGTVTAFDRSGTIVWSRSLYSDMVQQGASFTRAGFELKYVFVRATGDPETFIAGSFDTIFGCSARDGSIQWRVSVIVPYSLPNVDRGRVIALHDNRFVVVDQKSGGITRDSFVLDLPSVHGCGPGIIRGDRIAFPHRSGHLALIDIPSGELVKLYEGKASLGGGTVSEGRLLIGADDGHLLVFDESVWGP